MPLPLTTTTALVEVPASGEDPYEETASTWQVWEAALPCVVSGYSGSARRVGGDQQVVSATLFANVSVPFPARVTDLSTGEVYTVDWSRTRYELGLGHCKAGLTLVSGAADG